MPSKKTVDSWNYSCVGYEVDNEGKVILLWCKIKRNSIKNNEVSNYTFYSHLPVQRKVIKINIFPLATEYIKQF